MATKRKKAVAAVQEWKARMVSAKEGLPESIGMQDVIERVIAINPKLDSLLFATRWRNAWYVKVSDPEITLAVEEAAAFFKLQKKDIRSRLGGQKLVS